MSKKPLPQNVSDCVKMTCCYFSIAGLRAPAPGLLSEDAFFPDKNHKFKFFLARIVTIEANNLFFISTSRLKSSAKVVNRAINSQSVTVDLFNLLDCVRMSV